MAPPGMNEGAIDDLTAVWVRLTDALDYRAGKWWAPDERGVWRRVSWPNVHDLLYDLGIGAEPAPGAADPERDRMIEEFKRRDRATHPRPYSDVAAAQRRFGRGRMLDEPRFNGWEDFGR
jgi:hypothetical protein